MGGLVVLVLDELEAGHPGPLSRLLGEAVTVCGLLASVAG